MNRIILIGNGFDLAHGLRTSYAEFIKGYHNMRSYQLIHENEVKPNDGLCIYEEPDSECRKLLNQVRTLTFSDRFSYITRNYIEEIFQKFKKKYSSKFFEEINTAVETYNWVDIEAIYYRWLTKIFKQSGCEYGSPEKLNYELKLLENNLILYLTYIQAKCIKPELVKDCIQQIIYEPFSINDISVSGQEQFQHFIKSRWEEKNVSKQNNYAGSEGLIEKLVEVTTNLVNEKNFDEHFAEIQKGNQQICEEYLLPSEILLLNFNYTKMGDFYLKDNANVRVNHIHGELANKKNPIIFGYGDELDEDYKKISNLNDNNYLSNIKSIRYLETDNYRKLLSFIDSAPFQIYIMGHSCGNSDRTLLNTLFEHKNCVSIKPFYYERPNGTDNYIEIVQNISRNFNDMRLMRDRVVNKTYCRPMVEVTTE